MTVSQLLPLLYAKASSGVGKMYETGAAVIENNSGWEADAPLLCNYYMADLTFRIAKLLETADTSKADAMLAHGPSRLYVPPPSIYTRYQNSFYMFHKILV